ncbi:MAG: hypothetical protein ABI172_00110 [Ginsengibacter sp.]|jgi:hypothetical protein
MKLFTICIIALFLFGSLASCNEHYMDRTDVVKGTPSKSDTVLPRKYPPIKTEASIEAHNEKLPRVFLR